MLLVFFSFSQSSTLFPFAFNLDNVWLCSHIHSNFYILNIFNVHTQRLYDFFDRSTIETRIQTRNNTIFRLGFGFHYQNHIFFSKWLEMETFIKTIISSCFKMMFLTWESPDRLRSFAITSKFLTPPTPIGAISN